MYKILPQSEGNILGLEVSGTIDGEQERALIAQADAILATHDTIKILVAVNQVKSWWRSIR